MHYPHVHGKTDDKSLFPGTNLAYSQVACLFKTDRLDFKKSEFTRCRLFFLSAACIKNRDCFTAFQVREPIET